MKRVIVQYKVKADQADENRRLIEAVFASLQEASPENLRYASFVKEDGVSFVHIASIETSDGSNPLEEIAAFDSFTEAIGDRCEIPPQVAVLEVVGSYKLLGD
jgi:hypothetical protein